MFRLSLLLNRIAAVSILTVVLFLLSPRAKAEDASSYKFQYYLEKNDRIEVRAHYLRAEKDLNEKTSLTVVGLIDAISGASPTGAPPPAGSDQVPLAKLEDERRAVVVNVGRTLGIHRLLAEASYSKEDDYLSRGLALSAVSELNEKNTAVRTGVSFTNDDIFPSFFSRQEDKHGMDLIVGVTQTVNPTTLFTANLSWGKARGYLNDPYKTIQKTIQLTPTISRSFQFSENRPRDRENWIVYTALTHFFEPLHASGEATYRYFKDEFGSDSHTLTLEWFQKFGAKLVIRPSLRLYSQRAADFYYPTLDRTPIAPNVFPSAQSPFYSADYRLSKLRSYTYGVKAVYSVREWLSLDLNLERYEMRGRDGVTPKSAYPTADIVTVGLKLWY